MPAPGRRICLLLGFVLATGLVGVSGATQLSGDGLWVLDGCSRSAPRLAQIQPSDSLHVLYSIAGEEQACYAVSVIVRNTPVRGYLLGIAHPAIAAFDHEVRRRVPAAPPPETRETLAQASSQQAGPPVPVGFAGLRSMDVKGRRIDLDAMAAPVVLLYFWSPKDPKALKEMEMLGYVYEQYHGRGLDLVGVASGQSADSVMGISREHEATWPQILDTGNIAKKYHVGLEKPYYLLDRRRNVIESLSSAKELDGVLQGLDFRK